MRLLKWYVLDNKQFKTHILLSVVMCISSGILINVYFGKASIFKEVLPTVFYALLVIIIMCQLSPMIVLRFYKTNDKGK